MNVIQPKLRPYHEEITSEREIIVRITDAVVEAVRRARDSYNVKRPLNDLGLQRYGNVVENLTERLSEFGFYRNDQGCQVRLECDDPERYSQPIRILACKGVLDTRGNVHYLRVNKKGLDGRRLIEQNAEAWGRQLLLPDIGDGADIPVTTQEQAECVPASSFKNFWVCWETEGSDDDLVLTVYVALPETLNKAGTLFDCGIECHIVWCDRPFAVQQEVAELPQGQAFFPVVEDRDEDDIAAPGGATGSLR